MCKSDGTNKGFTPTYQSPKQPCRGIRRVYVNGVLTALDGVHTGAKSGQILRKGQ